ncbi:Phosphatidylserine decarboxylase [Alteracholeplasma palmae J233]|uniref:Phosphatidylserine decarboxylase n=1 Tax=Alteracholeplasma palmae (strain ATCC 49389 / J233) TaxID=1318466 RepID=U4KM09_ALTPJ|nr:phosphatidylserine decarboxylase [Alteracholeplasma palmae]CCV64983.1 Phosphatidylserine decarboxylase [Alteracholeplasma palmae J233]
MKIVRKNGEIVRQGSSSKLQKFLYRTLIGRIILRLLITKVVSFSMGLFMNSFLSKIFIKGFIKKNKIDLSLCEKKKFKSYNDFFTRKLKEVSYDKEVTSFISPASSKLSAYVIKEDLTYTIKNSQYSIENLLQNSELANQYKDGYLLVFRLEVDDYHRYIFTDNGKIIENKKIKGRFHTVNPIAFEKYDVFKENNREYTIIESDNFSQLVQIEVGALMVGKIKNHDVVDFKKGDEKGLFLFGGSTVVILVKKDIIKLNPIYLENTKNNCETIVSIGEKIGDKL